jgi:hypothetical protein
MDEEEIDVICKALKYGYDLSMCGCITIGRLEDGAIEVAWKGWQRKLVKRSALPQRPMYGAAGRRSFAAGAHEEAIAFFLGQRNKMDLSLALKK